jgi:hypothetical protein
MPYWITTNDNLARIGAFHVSVSVVSFLLAHGLNAFMHVVRAPSRSSLCSSRPWCWEGKVFPLLVGMVMFCQVGSCFPLFLYAHFT